MKTEKNVSDLIEEDDSLAQDIGFYLKTDRKVYKMGEEVVLTLKNKSKEPLYIYPTYEQCKQVFRMGIKGIPDMSREELTGMMVSADPAMTGFIYRSHPDYLYLQLTGIESEAISSYGYNGFDAPLKSGEKIVFNVNLPEKAGYYRFMIPRISRDPSFSYWGMNVYMLSNAFEVKQ